MTEEGSIHPWQIKKLLTDLHALGENWRTVRFLDICNQAIYVYGEKGTVKRKAIQKKYHIMKNLSGEQLQRYRERNLSAEEIEEIDQLPQGKNIFAIAMNCHI